LAVSYRGNAATGNTEKFTVSGKLGIREKGSTKTRVGGTIDSKRGEKTTADWWEEKVK